MIFALGLPFIESAIRALCNAFASTASVVIAVRLSASSSAICSLDKFGETFFASTSSVFPSVKPIDAASASAFASAPSPPSSIVDLRRMIMSTM